jgi:DNA replication protein DnaC
MKPTTPSVAEQVAARLEALKLFAATEELCTRLTAAGHAEALPVVLEVLDHELESRQHRRVERLRRASRLPMGKTFETLADARLPKTLRAQLHELKRGEFLERAANVLMFGLPGVGKSHAASALGHALVQAGHPVLFVPAYELVQELLVAKKDLSLPRALRRLDLFELLIIDDIGYVKQSADEAEVLFTLLAERYERRSTLITSNLVFSEWSRIFKDTMTTAAAIDRLVHHSVILEFATTSYRTEAAKKRGALSADASTESQSGASSPRTPSGSAPERPNSGRSSTELKGSSPAVE